MRMPERPRRLLAWLLAALALALVFSLYTGPDMAVDLATRLWSCL